MANDDVHFPTDTRVAEQLLDIHQPRFRAIDFVLAGTVTKHPARNSHFAIFNRQVMVRVVERQRDFRPTKRFALTSASEDDVFHLPTAQVFRPLLAHHPRQRVNHVGLARPVGPYHCANTGLEFHRGR